MRELNHGGRVGCAAFCAAALLAFRPDFGEPGRAAAWAAEAQDEGGGKIRLRFEATGVVARTVTPLKATEGGKNFGVGSAREQAAMAFAHLGVGAILAESFSRIFYRNAINFGIPLLLIPEGHDIEPGQLLEVNATDGVIRNATTGSTWKVEGIPEHLMGMIEAGGLMPWLKQRYAGGSSAR